MAKRDSPVLDSRPEVSAAPGPPNRWQGSSIVTQVAVLTWRTLRQFLTDPRQIVLSLAQPLILSYVIASVFSKLGNHLPGYPPGIPFFKFMLPAVLVDNTLQTSVQTGAGLIDDLRNGVVARLRSLPILPSSMLIARSLTGIARTVLQTSFLLVLAQLTHGDISRGGLVGIVESMALIILLAWSLGWVFLAAALWIRRAETLTSLSAVVMIPLVFISSAYVPVNDLPAGLAAFGRINPLSYAINAERAFFLTGSITSIRPGVILPPILTCVILGTAGALIAVRVFRRPLQVTWP